MFNRPTPHARVATYLATIGVRVPLATLTHNGRQITDADGRIVLLVIPSDDPAADHDVARAVCVAMNEAAGVDTRDLDHIDDLRIETERAARQMGGLRNAAE